MAEFRILLADDDEDDRLFFEDALEDIGYPTLLTLAKNGVELMGILTGDEESMPEILFLDLNMPLKNGVECLSEIRADRFFDKLIIIIYSTSLNKDTVELLYRNGADYYIQKPSDYEGLKKVVKKVLDLIKLESKKPDSINSFIITPK
ncbi:response regulator [Sediminicola sp. 1XM1-17]|uniref:response regulator n=1 Tax=Sediminicola sp. 1XM1-17 TaxID=3127702 RepID=UPI003076CB49